MTDPDALIVGAGPAGLMAADALSAAGRSVVIAEQMPSAARKFLMAGKSGLNLTRAEDPAAFLSAYDAAPLAPILRAFGPAEVVGWAESLGQEVFTGSTGRVFPTAMKASPLLRAWLARLAGRGVALNTRWRWTGGAGFDTPQGPRTLAPRVTVLAMGGASWRRLGSDGLWAERLGAAGLPVTPFAPANAGLSVAWSPHMARHHGQPVKNTGLIAGTARCRGEFVVTQAGLEGGGLYPLTPALRSGAPLALDLKPDWPRDRIASRLAAAKGSVSNRLRKALRLDPVQIALLMEFGRPLPKDLAPLIKCLPVRHAGLRPMDQAISTAGGLSWDALDAELMLTARPGTFACGEMLDWEAPTGGYLITACLATGRHAGLAAARRLDRADLHLSGNIPGSGAEPQHDPAAD